MQSESDDWRYFYPQHLKFHAASDCVRQCRWSDVATNIQNARVSSGGKFYGRNMGFHFSVDTHCFKPFFSIVLNFFNAYLVGYKPSKSYQYSTQYVDFQLTKKKVMINIWPNRDDSNHVLIMTIHVNSETGERSEWAFSLIIEK
jgi:hypothetical protein